MNLPQKFQETMKEILKTDYEKYVNSLNFSAKKGFRINENYIKSDCFDKIFNYQNKKLKIADNLRELLDEEKLGNTVFHHAGMIYMQEPSSMLSALSLDVKEGEKILDLCSAPGGKTGQILEKNKTGVVVCNEIIRARANILFSNIERQGYKNSVVTSLSPQVLSVYFLNYFDKILVDAPCSGEGMFRKDAQTIFEWNEGLPKFNHERQMDILKEADKMLKQGGILVYSTCTFNLEENEKTVKDFCDLYGYELIDLPDVVAAVTTRGFVLNGLETLKKCGRCFPQNNFGEGQFIAKMVKKSENNADNYKNSSKKNKIVKKEEDVVKSFLKENLNRDNFIIYKNGENISISETELPFVDNGLVNIGVNVGKIENARLVPHHQIFKCYGMEMKNVIKLGINDEKIQAYLKGNEIDVENVSNGYACVTTCGVPIGGGKVVNGRLKNYYPKGLRNK